MWPFTKEKNDTVEIQLDDGKGGKIRKRVNKAEFHALVDPAVADGRVEILDACIANILDPFQGVYKDNWVVGSHLTRKQFDEFSEDGEVYVLVFLEAGEPVTRLTKRELWEIGRKKIEMLS